MSRDIYGQHIRLPQCTIKLFERFQQSGTVADLGAKKYSSTSSSTFIIGFTGCHCQS